MFKQLKNLSNTQIGLAVAAIVGGYWYYRKSQGKGLFGEASYPYGKGFEVTFPSDIQSYFDESTGTLINMDKSNTESYYRYNDYPFKQDSSDIIKHQISSDFQFDEETMPEYMAEEESRNNQAQEEMNMSGFGFEESSADFGMYSNRY